MVRGCALDTFRHDVFWNRFPACFVATTRSRQATVNMMYQIIRLKYLH